MLSHDLPAREGLATCASAQAYLDISRSTLWRLSRQGVLTPVRIGRAVRYRWSDLHALAKGGAA
jgi:excisionase family DNA binding protein